MKSLARWTREVRRIAIVTGAALSLGACSETTTPRVATTVAMASGNNQTIAPGSPLSAPLVVTVLDQDGLALSGVTVTWSITSGEGALSVTSSTTDANGQATNSSYAAGSAGDIVITATVSGLTPVQFEITVEATDTGDSGGT